MNPDDFRRRAAAVREVPLQTVLIYRGAVRDQRDRSKWHTEQGPISITGPKFINWHGKQGGGGAIDLVMHLAGMDCRAAVAWLEEHIPGSHVTVGAAAPPSSHNSCDHHRRELQLPPAVPRMLDRVRQYLTGRRHLAPSVLEPLIQSGRLYADHRANAVFLLVAGKANQPVGAELRGTGPRPWRGMAPGTSKDRGYFWIGVKGARQIVLCESAIDAISCFQIDPQRICISTSGVRANPPWLSGLIARGFHVHCGFDADDAGESAAAHMTVLHPAVLRLRPPAHDWNDALAPPS